MIEVKHVTSQNTCSKTTPNLPRWQISAPREEFCERLSNDAIGIHGWHSASGAALSGVATYLKSRDECMTNLPISEFSAPKYQRISRKGEALTIYSNQIQSRVQESRFLQVSAMIQLEKLRRAKKTPKVPMKIGNFLLCGVLKDPQHARRPKGATTTKRRVFSAFHLVMKVSSLLGLCYRTSTYGTMLERKRSERRKRESGARRKERKESEKKVMST